MRIHLSFALFVAGLAGSAACGSTFLASLLYQGRTESGERLSNGQQTGHWKYWYDAGRQHMKSEGDFENDKHVGLWTFWHENGAKSFEVTLIDDVYEGRATSWYPNGKMHAQGSYSAGLKDGAWTFWREDGSQEQEGRFAKGARQGEWTYYAAGNVKQDTVPFKNDEPVASAAPSKPASTPNSAAGNSTADPKPTSGGGSTTSDERKTSPHVVEAPPPPVPKTGVVALPMTTLQTGEAASDPQVAKPATLGVERLAAIYDKGKGALSGGASDSYGVNDPRNPPSEPKRNDTKSDAMIGKPLPYTRITNYDGKILDLKQFQGKSKVLLIILRGMKGGICEYCCAQTMALENRIPDLKKAGAEVVIVYPGEEEALSIFLDNVQGYYKRQYGTEARPDCILGCDTAMKLVDGLGLRDLLARPTSLVIDKEGIVRFAFVGRDKQDRLCVDRLVQEIARLP